MNVRRALVDEDRLQGRPRARARRAARGRAGKTAILAMDGGNDRDRRANLVCM